MLAGVLMCVAAGGTGVGMAKNWPLRRELSFGSCLVPFIDKCNSTNPKTTACWSPVTVVEVHGIASVRNHVAYNVCLGPRSSSPYISGVFRTRNTVRVRYCFGAFVRRPALLFC
jgi:hypothetical protein